MSITVLSCNRSHRRLRADAAMFPLLRSCRPRRFSSSLASRAGSRGWLRRSAPRPSAHTRIHKSRRRSMIKSVSIRVHFSLRNRRNLPLQSHIIAFIGFIFNSYFVIFFVLVCRLLRAFILKAALQTSQKLHQLAYL